MTLTEFRSLVEQNAKWFQGVHPETAITIAEAERRLGKSLPSSLTWLLTEWGYSVACGVDSLDDAVTVTLRLRENLRLPERYIILNDRHDAGIVFLDTATPNENGEYPIYWAGTHNIARLANNEAMDADMDTFPDFPDWVVSRLESAKKE